VTVAHEPSGLPWRGPAPGRPAVPIPPDPMPLMRGGRPRKRWRYVGVYCDRVMLAAARVQIGPFRQTFWSLLDRDTGEARDRTRMVGGDVRFEGETLHLEGGDVRAQITLGGGGEAIESVCPSGESGYGWTRKRSGVEVSGSIEVRDGGGWRGWKVDGPRGMDDQSAGYHRRHTQWLWSAGVGMSRDGRELAWNLVTGINDPARGSERAIWVDGRPSEPEPVRFDGLDAVDLAGGERMTFTGEAERSRDDNMLLIKSSYTHRFGTFAGSLGGIELASGLGVMERHEALW
jgi:uncharacterized protein DUF2804